MNLNERITINVMSGVLALAAALFLARQRTERPSILVLSTPILTGILLFYFHLFVEDPAHGMAIMVLPLATGWLWWRRQQTGKPSFSPAAFVRLQMLYCLLYAILAWLQES